MDRVLIRVRDSTEFAWRKEQSNFRPISVCIDQVFAVRQVCEKYLANGKVGFEH